MPQSEKRMQELLIKANSLPSQPGVYIMRSRSGSVIYVGKSRKLKNRVSQYFQNSKKNAKTERMVHLVEDFDYILCSSEIEALTLENTLIKQYSPKYNIRLKDAKTYPYIKVTAEKYPRLICTRTRLADKAKYYGPFTGTSTIFHVLDIIRKSLGIPNCRRRFPEDIGKERPCLYYQMNQCCGVCTGKVTEAEYASLIRCAEDMLAGNTAGAIREIEKRMYEFAEKEQFESAARSRDTIKALTSLGEKQNMVASPDTDRDVFGIYSDERCTCISALYIRSGAVIDKADYVFGASTIIDSNALGAFIAEHYRIHEYIPREILTSFRLDESDVQMLSEYLSMRAKRKVSIRVPQRGDMRGLCVTADDNAAEKAKQYVIEAGRDEDVLTRLAEILSLEVIPERIEAYDISNIGADNKTCGMIVCENGKFNRSEYRSFNIKTVSGTDDYASMAEALERRFTHILSEDSPSFSKYPDLILLDGGRSHVSVVKLVAERMGVDVPIFGMVKDEYHKTRALCNESEEINIAKTKSVFMLIYGIQEEVHRFSVGKMTNAKRKSYKRSSLEKIEGIGQAKAAKLLREFGGLAALHAASEERIAAVKGISRRDAQNIVAYFNKTREKK